MCHVRQKSAFIEKSDFIAMHYSHSNILNPNYNAANEKVPVQSYFILKQLNSLHQHRTNH